MTAMGRIFMYLDDTDLTATGLTSESGNLMIYVQNIGNFASPFGGSSWWTGGGADQFFSSINACVDEIKDFALEIVNLYDRIALEEDEWTSVDTAYRYSPDALKGDLPTVDFASGNILPSKFDSGLEFKQKFSLKNQLGPYLPWQLRYPADADVKHYKGFLGLDWTEKNTYGDWDGGIYTGVSGKDAGGGLFLKGNAWKSVASASFLGIPLAFTRTGPSYEVKGGIDGVEGSVSLGGVELNFGGVDLSLDAGWGWGTDGKEFKAGPFTIGLDLGVYKDADAAPTRPPF
jgi:hypothetical protein